MQVGLYIRLGFIPKQADTKSIEVSGKCYMWPSVSHVVQVALSEALPDVLSANVGELNFKNVRSQGAAIHSATNLCCDDGNEEKGEEE